VTTAAIGGIVANETGRGLPSAQVLVVNRATGFAVDVHSGDDGRYLVQGLEIGGPYSVAVKRIGFKAQESPDVVLTLGQNLRLDFRLEQLTSELPAVLIHGAEDPVFSRSHTGVATAITDSALRRLPTIDRDLYGFVQLTPQISTGHGLSGGGVNSRFNSILIDGASEQAFFNNSLAAGAAFGGHAISLEAVKEYQILLSPYDVRHGKFAGALINAVTKSGTNDLAGTAFYYFANERLARNVSYLRESPYNRAQFGFSMGGPIVRDRAHFFLATELQHMMAPASGPFAGHSDTPVPADTADISRFARALQRYSLRGGSPGAVSNSNPLVNTFARMDLALPSASSRLVLRYNYNAADSDAFSRPIPRETSSFCWSTSCFPLSSVGRRHHIRKHATVAQLYTNRPSGANNELIVASTEIFVRPTPNVREPLILVAVPHVNGSDTAFLESGTIDLVQGNALLNHRLSEITDNVTFPTAGHRVTVGATANFYRVRNSRLRGSYGIWSFDGLGAFEQGDAADYRVSKDFGGADATIVGAQYAFYAGDQWQLGERISLTVGLRADVPVVSNRPPYAAAVDSIFARRTDIVPSGRMQLSPRLGFNWDIYGDRRDQLRGGVGMFTGRPPVAWLLNAFSNYGTGIGVLHCSVNAADATSVGPPPLFPAAPDYQNPPSTCANGQGYASGVRGPINLLSEHLRFPQTLRVTLGYDRHLPRGIVATVEGLYTRGTHDFLFVNRNLAGPVGTDRRGRIMYGVLNRAGIASTNSVTKLFPEVIDLENESGNYSYNITGQLEKAFSEKMETKAAYTYSRSRDVQSPLDFRAYDAWRFGRALSGRHDDRHLGVSDFDQPHRVVLVTTYTAPWQVWKTDLSLYYVGASGVPYTFTPRGEPLRTGDLNADGSGANDPIYVPTSANDTAQIRFAPTTTGATAAEQAKAAAEVVEQQIGFEHFIRTTRCLRQQRGRIMRRNSCRGPWVQTANVSLRQRLPSWAGRTLSLQLDVFNFLNLLNGRWGRYRIPNTAVLTHVGQTGGLLWESQPIFRFDSKIHRDDWQNPASNYQIQLAARYSF